jgi:predicted transcriptional regulator
VDEPQSSIGGAELEVLKALWEHGPGTVREINARLQDRGRAWAYTTVQTMLHRLEGKGLVRAMPGERPGSAHRFQAAVSRERLLSRKLSDLANQLCDGTRSPLLLALVEGHRFTPAEIRQLRQRLDELEQATPRKSATRNR